MIGELAALGASLSWAIAPILYRKALVNTKPISANIVRCATNAGVLVAVLLLFGIAGALDRFADGNHGFGCCQRRNRARNRRHPVHGWAQIRGRIPRSSLAATYPLFSLIWATFLLGQPLSIRLFLAPCSNYLRHLAAEQRKKRGESRRQRQVGFHRSSL